MIYFVSVIHALTCVFVVLFILLQDPKGGVLGNLGGGGGKSFFGSEGASPFLVNVTKWLAICFACSSFYLSYMSSQKEGSIMTGAGLEQIDTQRDKPPEESAAGITGAKEGKPPEESAAGTTGAKEGKPPEESAAGTTGGKKDKPPEESAAGTAL